MGEQDLLRLMRGLELAPVILKGQLDVATEVGSLRSARVLTP
jgi:hypothetical protein